jgi:AcrR family transcriptional regulator
MPEIAPGRRERNKQEKLGRILAAASELFAEHGADEVTTQQIADRADIGAGTLFLYAKSKGELLLMVQNAHYVEALIRGRAAAEPVADTLDAVMALMQPIVECNREHPENGRTYLREMVFGDSDETHHAEAVRIAGESEEALADLLGRDLGKAEAAAFARVASALMFVSMASAPGSDPAVEQILFDIRRQLAAVLPRG